MSEQRPTSLTAQLVRRGFADPSEAAQILDEMGMLESEDFADALATAADPDQALRAIHRLVGAGVNIQDIAADEAWFAALVAAVGMSAALADHLARHPGSVERLRGVALRAPSPGERRERLLRAVDADPGADSPVASIAGAADALRVAYRDELLTTVVRDLVHGARVDDIAEELADLADAALEAGLAIARAELPADSVPCRLAIIAMGKCGGRELNYVSDVDVIFVAEPLEGGDEEAALRTATRLASGVLRAAVKLRLRVPCGRWMLRCAPRASREHSCARSPRTSATTSAGPRPGSSRHCSRPAPRPVIGCWGRRTSTQSPRSSGLPLTVRTSSRTCRGCDSASRTTSPLARQTGS
jgi:glutamate-ammonia-ligase adenylyltransferase